MKTQQKMYDSVSIFCEHSVVVFFFYFEYTQSKEWIIDNHGWGEMFGVTQILSKKSVDQSQLITINRDLLWS